jgi:hypothetical protein
MTEDVVCTSITEVKNYGHYLFRIKCKWENEVGKTLPLLEAGGGKIKCETKNLS